MEVERVTWRPAVVDLHSGAVLHGAAEDVQAVEATADDAIELDDVGTGTANENLGPGGSGNVRLSRVTTNPG